MRSTLCALLAALLLAGCATVQHDPLAPRCELHDVPLRPGVAPMQYGLVDIDEDYLIRMAEEFPNSYSHILGGCVVSRESPRFATVLYCPECRRDDPAWRVGMLEKMWEKWNRPPPAQKPPPPIQVEFQFVEVSDPADAHAGGGRVSAEAILALLRNGRAKILSSPVARLHADEEATVKAVKEFIYPSEFSFEPAGTNTAGVASIVVKPAGFEIREVGTILSVYVELPETNGYIHVSGYPEIVSNPEWKEFGSQYTDPSGKIHTASIQQPFFHTVAFEINLTVQDGKPVLVGGGMPSQDTGKVVFGILTATILDMGEQTVEPGAEKRPSKAAPLPPL